MVPLDLLLLLLPLLPLDRQELLLERDLDVLRVEARDFRLDHQGLLRLGHVHAGRPVAQYGELVELEIPEAIEDALELLLEIGHPGERHHGSHRVLLVSRRVRVGARLSRSIQEATQVPETNLGDSSTCPATDRTWWGAAAESGARSPHDARLPSAEVPRIVGSGHDRRRSEGD